MCWICSRLSRSRCSAYNPPKTRTTRTRPLPGGDPTRGRRPELTAATEQAEQARKERYLRAVAAVGTLTAGCKAAHVSPHTVYAWREQDTAFLIAEHEAREA